jgi:hypothetical protein
LRGFQPLPYIPNGCDGGSSLHPAKIEFFAVSNARLYIPMMQMLTGRGVLNAARLTTVFSFNLLGRKKIGGSFTARLLCNWKE